MLYYNEQKRLNPKQPDYHKKLRWIRQKRHEVYIIILKLIIALLFILLGLADFICPQQR